MSGKVVSIIQARTGSTRLPRKIILDLEGKTVLEHVIARTKLSRLTDQLVAATSINRDDLAIVKICNDLGVSVYCGSEEDPLDRYYQAARLFKASHVVRIKADCPLIDPGIIDKQNPTFGMEETLDFLSRHEDMEKINRHIHIAEGLLISLSTNRDVELDLY